MKFIGLHWWSFCLLKQWRAYHDWKETMSARGTSLAYTAETVSLSLLLYPTPVGMGMHSSFIVSRWQCKSPSCMCCPRSPAVLQNHNSPMASEVLRPVSSWTLVGHPGEMCPEMASQNSGHHWCTPAWMALDPPSNHRVAHQEHEVSLSYAPGGEWRSYSLNRLLTKLEVSAVIILSGWLGSKQFSLTKLSAYHFNAITWSYKSDSKFFFNVVFKVVVQYFLFCFCLTLDLASVHNNWASW